MSYESSTLAKAIELIISLDSATISAARATLLSSGTALLSSSLIGLPLGFCLGFYKFRGKEAVRTLVNTLLSFPTVVTGLLVYMLLSNQGPLGHLGLLFTLPGVSIGLAFLALPLIVSLTATAIESADESLRLTLLTLGANPWQVLFTYLRELRFQLMTAVVAAFGRVVSEVGIAMMVGGNIKWHTRTMTTAISLETGKGDFATALALGFILLGLALLVNIMLAFLQTANTSKIKLQ